MNGFPDAFIASMKDLLGAETDSFLSAMDQPPTLALRINPLKTNSRTAALPYIDSQIPWEPMGYYLKSDVRPGTTIEHAAGAFYLQEASAMLSVAALDPLPGERILDLCAAPGGKTTQIAGRMRGKGFLLSNEYDPSRSKILAATLERIGVTNAIAVNARPDVLANRMPGYFDAVLCDAPCSGEGMFRRDPAARTEWEPGSPSGCANRQAEILDSAADLIRPGGRLVYSTCTFNRTENEDTITAFLNRHPEFIPEDFSVEGVGSSTSGCLRIWPHRQRGDGHFCARLRKAGDSPLPEPPVYRNTRDDIQLVHQLQKEICSFPVADHMKLQRMGDYLYAIPAECPDIKGLRVPGSGVCLLRIGKGYIEPAHALAMCLSANAAQRIAELDTDRAVRYLAGESIEYSETKGWTLVTYSGLPLGWGKVSNDQLKNHLPKGLRLSLHL